MHTQTDQQESCRERGRCSTHNPVPPVLHPSKACRRHRCGAAVGGSQKLHSPAMPKVAAEKAGVVKRLPRATPDPQRGRMATGVRPLAVPSKKRERSRPASTTYQSLKARSRYWASKRLPPTEPGPFEIPFQVLPMAVDRRLPARLRRRSRDLSRCSSLVCVCVCVLWVFGVQGRCIQTFAYKQQL